MAAPKIKSEISVSTQTMGLHLVEAGTTTQESTGLLDVKDFGIRYAPVSDEGLAIASLVVVLSNNSKYKARLTEPVDSATHYDRIVEKSPAWWTDENDTFNVDWTKMLAAQGMTVLDTSHEHVLHGRPLTTARRFLGSSLLNDTHAQLAILRLIREEQLTLEPMKSEVISTGLSKSSITGVLKSGRAAGYGLQIPYTDGIDPSGEHPWSKHDLPDLMHIFTGSISEGKELAEVVAEYSPTERRDALWHHMVMSPQALAGHLAATKSLVLSDAGKYFISPSPENAMHITCFRNCWFNQHRGWMRRLGDLVNVHVDVLPGGHLRGGRKDIRAASVERIARMQDSLKNDHKAQDIDPATQRPRQPLAA